MMPRENFDYAKIRDKALRGPRVTTLMRYFEDIASGIKQKPKKQIEPESSFMRMDSEYGPYYEVYRRNLGTFNRHAIASIPYSLEQCIRMGVGLCRFARAKAARGDGKLTFYGMSAADGTHARTIAEYSDGQIMTLSDSPNESNFIEFRKRLNHGSSYFHVGPFVDITPEFITTFTPSVFREGFDVIWESTTFQMYGDNRDEQIAYVKRVLKPTGLMLFFEKMSHRDVAVYEERESAKDVYFKSRYFTEAQIETKRTEILSEMKNGQVTFEEISRAIKNHFLYARIIWNSGNFYEIIASNSQISIDEFTSTLPDPFVPESLLFDRPLGRSIF